jgi:hypothetical protein
MYVVEWRNVINDVNVTPWEPLTELHSSFDDALEALDALMRFLPVRRTGFSEDDGLHTGRGYGEATLFEAIDYPRFQYRIVRVQGLEGILIVKGV